MFPLLGLLILAQLSPVHCNCPGWTCEISGLEKDGWETCAICFQWLSTNEEETQSERFAKMAKALKHNYRVVGYLDAKVEYEANPQGKDVDLLITIHEGPHYMIRQIILEGVPDATPSELKELHSELLIETQTECNPTFAEVSARRLLNTGLVESVTF
ncbi:unnamed protein product, partial [marine sediment metagenome]